MVFIYNTICDCNLISGKAGLDLQHFKGKLVIKGIGPGGSSQKLTIPWVADVLTGGLEVNASVTHYCAPYSIQPRNFTVVNKYKLPLAITNVSLSAEAKTLFAVGLILLLFVFVSTFSNFFNGHFSDQRFCSKSTESGTESEYILSAIIVERKKIGKFETRIVNFNSLERFHDGGAVVELRRES